MSFIGHRKSRPFSFQLLTDRLLTLHALLKGFELIPLPDTRICGLTGDSAADWPHIERRISFDRAHAIEGTIVNIVTPKTK